MSFRSHSPRVLAVALLILSCALPSFARDKRRSVTPTAPPKSGKVNGTVVDATTNAPVVFATVTAGEIATSTDAAGKFELDLASGTVLTITRSGYQTATATAVVGQPLTVRLSGLPTIHVRMTAGKEYDLDFDSSQFAYAVPFSAYVRDDAGKFCKPDGSDFRPSKSTIKRFIGPATATTGTTCCKDKPTLKGKIEMKSGETTDVIFTDACFGYEVDFIGRNHVTGEFVFLKFNDIAEIVFP
jgi:hypothetical protein